MLLIPHCNPFPANTSFRGRARTIIARTPLPLALEYNYECSRLCFIARRPYFHCSNIKRALWHRSKVLMVRHGKATVTSGAVGSECTYVPLFVSRVRWTFIDFRHPGLLTLVLQLTGECYLRYLIPSTLVESGVHKNRIVPLRDRKRYHHTCSYNLGICVDATLPYLAFLFL